MNNKFDYAFLQDILRCPISKETLRFVTRSVLLDLNERVARRELFHYDGTPVQETFDAGFVSSSGQYFYPVIDGIIILLAHLSIPLASVQDAHLSLRAEKKILQDFYNQIGWLKGEQDTSLYVDAIKWEDLRPVVIEYAHRCHMRLNRYIPHSGTYLLDAGSGPVQYEEYLTYSEGYRYRICVDISLLALKEARKKLGEHGVYILGDITNIPLQDSSVDGAVSLHTIYHVPADEQLNAFREMYRTIKPGTTAAIVYSLRNSSLMKFFMFPRRVKRTIQQWITKFKSIVKKIIRWKGKGQQIERSGVPENPYHHTFDYRYLEENLADLNVSFFPWRSVGVPFMKTYVYPKFFGRQIMNWIYNFEEQSPQRAAQIGQYPIVVLSKK
jgi:SAM-dependent methyltransferase/uncharacterized protein YbaR (Trm112 family)